MTENDRLENQRKLIQTETTNRNEDIQNIPGKGMGIVFGCLFVVFACGNLAFIIPSLVYANQNSQCVLTRFQGIDLDLKTWLQVDAYTRIAIIGLLLLASIAFCISLKTGLKFSIFMIILILLYSIFAMAWLVVGSILFWVKLNPTGVCTGGIHDYMYTVLIVSYVAHGISCYAYLSKGKTQTT